MPFHHAEGMLSIARNQFNLVSNREGPCHLLASFQYYPDSGIAFGQLYHAWLCSATAHEVVACSVSLTNMSDFSEMNQVGSILECPLGQEPQLLAFLQKTAMALHYSASSCHLQYVNKADYVRYTRSGSC